MDCIKTLRADFALVRAWMVECGEWASSDAAEIGAGIAEAVKAGEQGAYGELHFWCDWMARWAKIAAAHRAQMAALDKAAAAWWREQGRKAA